MPQVPGFEPPCSNPRVRTFAPPDGRSILPGQNRSRSDTALHALTASPDISPTDRLSVTVFFSVLAHVIVILGVTFTADERTERRIETLDVVLVPQRPAERPDQADFLAQSSQDGGGTTDAMVRPAASVPAPATPPDTGGEGTQVGRLDRPGDLDPARDAGTDAAMSRSREIAALSAELDRRLESYASLPRRKWISGRTREHRFATYMDAWRRKVERIGNLNYPREAARHGLSGTLLLDVAIKPDGTVEDVVVRRSSGRQVLDDAAIRIVKLASPFAEFPEDIEQEVDVLHIVRTWIFHSENRFSSP